jgi:ribosome-binding factor A
MSLRTEKVESLVKQIVAQQLPELMGPDSARLTITGVDVSPDLRNATVWVGVFADVDRQKAEFDKVVALQKDFQRAVAKGLTIKFVPRLTFRHDTGGEYAEGITKLLRDL